jgi:hypothetical protein
MRRFGQASGVVGTTTHVVSRVQLTCERFTTPLTERGCGDQDSSHDSSYCNTDTNKGEDVLSRPCRLGRVGSVTMVN